MHKCSQMLHLANKKVINLMMITFQIKADIQHLDGTLIQDITLTFLLNTIDAIVWIVLNHIVRYVTYKTVRLQFW